MIVFVLGYAYMRNHICLWKASSGAEVAFLGHSSGILTDVHRLQHSFALEANPQTSCPCDGDQF